VFLLVFMSNFIFLNAEARTSTQPFVCMAGILTHSMGQYCLQRRPPNNNIQKDHIDVMALRS